MKLGFIATVATLGLSLATPAAAQLRNDTGAAAQNTGEMGNRSSTNSSASAGASTPARPAGSGLRHPWEGRFWGYAGLSLGAANYNIDCFPGLACDDDTGLARLFAGGNFNDTFGLEVAYVNFGKAQNAGGDMEAHGLNLSLTAGVPLGARSAVFGKLGTTYARTKVSGTVPAFATGSDDDWGLSMGLGARFGLTDRLSLRLDADRYRLQFVNASRRNVDALTVGLQYSF